MTENLPVWIMTYQHWNLLAHMDHWRNCSKNGKNSTYLLLKATILRPSGNLLELHKITGLILDPPNPKVDKIPRWLVCTLGLGSIPLFPFSPCHEDLSYLSGVKPLPPTVEVSLNHCTTKKPALFSVKMNPYPRYVKFSEATCNRSPTQVGWCLR